MILIISLHFTKGGTYEKDFWLFNDKKKDLRNNNSILNFVLTIGLCHCPACMIRPSNCCLIK